MADVKWKIIVAFISVLVLTSGIAYVTLDNQVRIRVDDDKSTFYVPHDDYSWIWTVSGREYNRLIDGSSVMRRSIRDISVETIVDNDSNKVFVVRTTPYIRGPVIKDIYEFNGDITNVELFPISHKVEVYNATGLFYRYTVDDLSDTGERRKLSIETSLSFGKNMKVELYPGYRWAWIGWPYGGDSLSAQYDITSDHETFYVRLFDPPDNASVVGYEIVPDCLNWTEEENATCLEWDNSILRFWNEYDDYYLNMSSGLQFTNHYDQYWTHNIFCAGYKTSQWNYLCNDDLPIQLTAYTDNTTFVEVNGTRVISIAGRNIGMGISYRLELGDRELNITTGVRHLSGAPITNDLAFVWKVKDIRVDGDYESDKVYLNGTSYDLSQPLDLLFTNMTGKVVEINETTNETIITYKPIPEYMIKDHSYIRLRWSPNLNYFLQIKNQTGQINAPITLAIVTSGLDIDQTKKTSFYWRDPINDISSYIYEGKNLDISANATPSISYTSGITFGDSGNAFYMIDQSTDVLVQYSLSTAYDISTATYVKSFDPSRDVGSYPVGLEFSSDGTKWYVHGLSFDKIYEYDMSTDWDISTSSLAKSASILVNTFGLAFSSDGTRFFIIDGSDNLRSYTMTTGWKLGSGISLDPNSFSVNSQESAPRTVDFNDAGTIMIVLGTSSDTIFQYELSEAWNVSTASYNSLSRYVGFQEASPVGLTYADSESKVYFVGDVQDKVFQYDSNDAPTHTTPIFSPSYPQNADNLTCLNQSTADSNGDSVTNVYNWLKNGTSITVLNMPFDVDISTVGAKSKDYSGFENNLTLGSGSYTPTWNSAASGNCKVGGCYYFDGNDDLAITDADTNSTFDNQEWTIMAWYNLTNIAAGYRTIIKKNGQFLLRSYTDDFYAYAWAPTATLHLSTNIVLANTWQHVTFVVNLTHISTYINGSYIGSTANSNTRVYSSSELSIGSNGGGGEGYIGYIDEVMVFNASLSPEQINMIYLEGLNGFSNSTIVSQETSSGDNWTCQLTPNDDFIDGTMKQISAVIDTPAPVSALTFGYADIGNLERDNWTTWAFREEWSVGNITGTFDEQGTSIYVNTDDGPFVAGHSVGVNNPNTLWSINATSGTKNCDYIINDTDRVKWQGIGHGWGGPVFFDGKLYSAYWDIWEWNITDCNIISNYTDGIVYSQAVQVSDDYVTAISFPNASYVTLNRSTMTQVCNNSFIDSHGWIANTVTSEHVCDFNEGTCVVSNSGTGANNTVKINISNCATIWNTTSRGFWDSALVRYTIDGIDTLFGASNQGNELQKIRWDNGTVMQTGSSMSESIVGDVATPMVSTTNKMWISSDFEQLSFRAKTLDSFSLIRAFNASNITQELCDIRYFETPDARTSSRTYTSFSQPIQVDDLLFFSMRWIHSGSGQNTDDDSLTFVLNETSCEVLSRIRYIDIDMYAYPIVANGSFIQMTSSYVVKSFDVGNTTGSNWTRLGFDNNLSARAPDGAVDVWKYLNINCTKNSFMNFNCTATNLYDYNITKINFTHNSRYSFDWYNSTGNLVANDVNIWVYNETMINGNSISFSLNRTVNNVNVTALAPAVGVAETDNNVTLTCNYQELNASYSIFEGAFFIDDLTGNGLIRNFTEPLIYNGTQTFLESTDNYTITYNPAVTPVINRNRWKVVLNGSCEDTYINEDQPTTNYGSATKLSSGRAVFDEEWITLIKFDNLPTEIMEGMTIASGNNDRPTLDLYFESYSANGDTAINVTLKKVLKPWVEDEATWNIWSTGNEWGVAGADNASDSGIYNTGDATGYDRYATDLNVREEIGMSTPVGYITFQDYSVNGNFTTLIQEWFDQPGNETHGIMLKSNDQNGEARFTSCDGASNKPVLTFYIVPVLTEDINLSINITLEDNTNYRYSCASRSFDDGTGATMNERFGWSDWTYFNVSSAVANFTIWDGTQWVLTSEENIFFRCTPTQKDCEPRNQNTGSSQCIYNITSIGNANATSVQMRINQTFSGINFFVDNDTTALGGLNITTTYQDIHGALNMNDSVQICAWANYTNPTSGGFFSVDVRLVS